MWIPSVTSRFDFGPMNDDLARTSVRDMRGFTPTLQPRPQVHCSGAEYTGEKRPDGAGAPLSAER